MSRQQPAAEDVLEAASRGARELEIEVVEGTTVLIVGFAGHTVLNGNIRGHFVSRQRLRHKLLDRSGSRHAELHTRGHCRVAAGKDAPEAVPIEESVTSGGWRNDHRGELAREAVIGSPHD